MKRVKLLSIAAALLCLVMIVGLVAYMTDFDYRQFEFLTAAPEDFDVTLSVMAYQMPETVLPGEEVPFNPTVANTGTEDMYGFLETYIPVYGSDDQEIYRYEFIWNDGCGWYPLGYSEIVEIDGVRYNRMAYAYITSDITIPQIIHAGESAYPIFQGLQLKLLDDDTYQEVSKDVIVYAYGIQIYGLGEPWMIDGANELKMTPDQIWELIKS